MTRYFIHFVLIVLFANFVSCSPNSDDTNEANFTSDHFTVSVIGEGPDVILVPGLASSPEVWEPIANNLQESYTFHLIHVSGFADAPARGNSGNQNILEDLSADLSAYSQSLEGPAHLVGHSLGGLVSLQAAMDPKSNFQSLVVVDVLPFFSVLMDVDATPEKMTPIAAIAKATLVAQTDDVFRSRQAQAIETLVKKNEHRELVLSWSVNSDREVMGQAMSEVLVTDLRQDIAEIDLPVTVIFARDEAIPNMKSIEDFYTNLYSPLRSGSVIGIDGAFHFIMLDQPDLFLEVLKNSLRQ